VKVVVLNLQGFLEIAQCAPQLLGPSENAGKVVIGHGPEAVALLGQRLCLPEQLERDIEVFFL
jgi:hypothetical protein